MTSTDVDFQAQNLQWRSYTTRDIFPTIKKVKFIGKKEFVAEVFNLKHEIFVLHVATFNISFDTNNKMHLSRRV